MQTEITQDAISKAERIIRQIDARALESPSKTRRATARGNRPIPRV
jgi:hypothetical protein